MYTVHVLQFPIGLDDATGSHSRLDNRFESKHKKISFTWDRCINQLTHTLASNSKKILTLVKIHVNRVNINRVFYLTHN